VVAGTKYYYQVSAVNSVGEGTRSSEIGPVMVTVGQTQAPTKPTHFMLVAAGTHQLILQWRRSTAYLSGNPVAVRGYLVSRDGSLIPGPIVKDVHYFDSLLAAGSAHTYQVRAIDDSNNMSPPATLKAKTLARAATRTATIGGVVYDWVGKPLANAVLTFTLQNGAIKRVKTGLHGVWSASALRPQWYTLTAGHAGYLSQTFKMHAAAHASTVAVSTLTPA
jgi:cellulose 1,4-beta-cellobiosidase